MSSDGLFREFSNKEAAAIAYFVTRRVVAAVTPRFGDVTEVQCMHESMRELLGAIETGGDPARFFGGQHLAEVLEGGVLAWSCEILLRIQDALDEGLRPDDVENWPDFGWPLERTVVAEVAP
jgi:hypothetical protein